MHLTLRRRRARAPHMDQNAPDNAAIMANVQLESTITCPACGHARTETMPTDACQWFYECESCATILRPKRGDCCVFCSYGTVKCPPIQSGGGCCTA